MKWYRWSSLLHLMLPKIIGSSEEISVIKNFRHLSRHGTTIRLINQLAISKSINKALKIDTSVALGKTTSTEKSGRFNLTMFSTVSPTTVAPIKLPSASIASGLDFPKQTAFRQQIKSVKVARAFAYMVNKVRFAIFVFYSFLPLFTRTKMHRCTYKQYNYPMRTNTQVSWLCSRFCIG